MSVIHDSRRTAGVSASVGRKTRRPGRGRGKNKVPGFGDHRVELGDSV